MTYRSLGLEFGESVKNSDSIFRVDSQTFRVNFQKTPYCQQVIPLFPRLTADRNVLKYSTPLSSFDKISFEFNALLVFYATHCSVVSDRCRFAGWGFDGPGTVVFHRSLRRGMRGVQEGRRVALGSGRRLGPSSARREFCLTLRPGAWLGERRGVPGFAVLPPALRRRTAGGAAVAVRAPGPGPGPGLEATGADPPAWRAATCLPDPLSTSSRPPPALQAGPYPIDWMRISRRTHE